MEWEKAMKETEKFMIISVSLHGLTRTKILKKRFKDFIWPNAWTIYKKDVREDELGVSLEIVHRIDSIQVDIDQLIKKEREDIQEIQRAFYLLMTNIYQKRDVVTKDIEHFWLKMLPIATLVLD